MSTITPLLQKRDIVYPESDGLPLADNTTQFRWITTIKRGLDAVFYDDLTSSWRETCSGIRPRAIMNAAWRPISSWCLGGPRASVVRISNGSKEKLPRR